MSFAVKGGPRLRLPPERRGVLRLVPYLLSTPTPEGTHPLPLWMWLPDIEEDSEVQWEPR